MRNTANLLEPGAPERVIAEVRPTHLLHLAWNAEPGKFWTTPENLDWVAASLRLLRAFGGERRSVSPGRARSTRGTDETHCVEGATPLVPATLYGSAKAALGQVARRGSRRRQGLSSPGAGSSSSTGRDERPARLFASVARSLLAGEPAPDRTGQQIRDFLHADDVGAAFAALIAATYGPVNLASGVGVAVRDLVAEIALAADRPECSELGALPSGPASPPRIVADARRLRDEVGFTPAFDLAGGIAARSRRCAAGMSDIVGTSAAGPAAIRGGLLRAAAFAGGLLLGVVAAPLLVRHLGDADFGRYSAVLAVIMIVNGLTEGGINTVAMRETVLRTGRVERDRAMRDLLGLRMVLSAVGIALAVAFSAAAGTARRSSGARSWPPSGWRPSCCRRSWRPSCRAGLRFGWAALIELVRQALVAAS